MRSLSLERLGELIPPTVHEVGWGRSATTCGASIAASTGGEKLTACVLDGHNIWFQGGRMNTRAAARSGTRDGSIADLGVVLGAGVGVFDRYCQLCERIASFMTGVGKELNIGVEQGFCAVAGPRRLDELAESARRSCPPDGDSSGDKYAVQAAVQVPDSVVTASVACARHGITRRTLQRAVKQGRLTSYPKAGKAANSPLRVDLQEVARIWPPCGATK